MKANTKLILELNDQKHLINTELATATNIISGLQMELKDFYKQLEKSQKGSKWELITESSPFDKEILGTNYTKASSYCIYSIDSKLFKYEMTLAMTDQGEVVALRYNPENGQEHFKVFFEIDNSLLSIVNNSDIFLIDESQEEEKESFLNSLVFFMDQKAEEVADDKPAYLLSNGELIAYSQYIEGYSIKKVVEKKANSKSRRTSI